MESNNSMCSADTANNTSTVCTHSDDVMMTSSWLKTNWEPSAFYRRPPRSCKRLLNICRFRVHCRRLLNYTIGASLICSTGRRRLPYPAREHSRLAMSSAVYTYCYCDSESRKEGRRKRMNRIINDNRAEVTHTELGCDWPIHRPHVHYRPVGVQNILN